MDCEATGLDPKQDKIIEVAVAVFDLEIIHEEYASLIDPECPIPEASIAIHHITPEMVMGMPKIHEILPKILPMFGNHTIVGHGIAFDIDLVANAAERTKIPCTIRNNKYLDTLRMARLYGESPVNSLQRLREHFNIEPEGAHRAMSDVIVNIGVFRQLIKDYKTVAELFAALEKPIKLKIMPLGRYKGRLLEDVPLDYLKSIAHKDFDRDLLFTIRSEINRRKKGKLFNQASNPFLEL